jgi:uncharacterized protein DUF5305
VRAAPLALAACILVAAFGGYLFVYSSQLPPTKEVTSSVMLYTQRATFAHTQTTQPNAVLNSTILSSGQGPIFENLTEEMSVSFAYFFTSNVPAQGNLSIEYQVMLSTKDWSVVLSSTPPSALPLDGAATVSSSRTFDLNITNIVAEIKAIQPSTGYFSPTYVLQVEPLVAGQVSPQGSPADSGSVTFAPTLNMTLANGLISLNGTGYSSTNNVSGTSSTPNSQAGLLRNLSFAAITGGGAGAAVSTAFTFRRREPASPEEELEAQSSFYQEAIAEIAGPPKTSNLVEVSSLRDLVKVSDTLGKPILRWRTVNQEAAENQYYVLDGQTGYRFELSLRPEAAAKAHPPAPTTQARKEKEGTLPKASDDSDSAP